MAENIPPPTTTTTTTSTMGVDQIRGLPYYEKLKKDLRETLQKKRLLDKNMTQLEDQIYRYESSYLEETSAGNIIKGFDNYIKGSGAPTGGSTSTATGGGGSGGLGGGGGGGGGGTSTRRKAGGNGGDEWRVFSRSSASFMRELSPPSSAQVSPPVGTPTAGVGGGGSGAVGRNGGGRGDETPTSATGGRGGGGQKKKKGEEEEEVGKGNKRLKINFSRGAVGD